MEVVVLGGAGGGGGAVVVNVEVKRSSLQPLEIRYVSEGLLIFADEFLLYLFASSPASTPFIPT